MAKPEVVNPRSGRKRKVDWVAVVEMARDNPGEWIKVPVALNSAMFDRLQKDKVADVPAAEFEFTSRVVKGKPNHIRTIYVKTR